MGEPLIHSHVTDVLPEDHPLAYDQVSCQVCGALVHAGNNECMQTWIEWDCEIVCMKCFLEFLRENPGEVEVLEILLPDHLLVHDFCGRECFEKWVSKREGLKLVEDHQEKFAQFFEMVAEADEKNFDRVIVHNPEVLGDNYAEVIANLDVLATANLELAIVPPDERGKKS
jgi:hypothetical protein